MLLGPNHDACKILILGAGFRNKGAEAMMRTVQRELTTRLGRVCCYAYLPREHASLAYSSGIVPVTFGNDRLAKVVGEGLAGKAVIYKRLFKTGDLRRFLKSFPCYRNVWNYVFPREVDERVGGFDAVMDVHGYAFGDTWGLGAPQLAREWTRFCLETCKRFIFMPQAWGSFQNKGFADPLRAMTGESSLYYARDTVSQSHLAGILAKSVDEIPLAPDIVLSFQGASLAVGAQLLHNSGVDVGTRPIIGLAPNMRVFERSKGKGTGNAYVQTLIQLCDYCVERLDAKVVMIPNELSPIGENRQDDRYLCGLIQAAAKSPSSCAVISEYHSAEEIKSVIGNCDLLIGSRFHALVFALSQSVPVLALSWSHKYRELLGQFGQEAFICEQDQIAAEKATELLTRLWGEREACAKNIAAALPPLLKQVDAVFNQAASIIQGEAV